jgi:hypothetical protein
VLTQLALTYHTSIAFPVVSDAVYFSSEMIVSIDFMLCIRVLSFVFVIRQLLKPTNALIYIDYSKTHIKTLKAPTCFDL